MTGAGETMRVAAVQTVSGGDVDANLAQAEPLIAAAAAEGARLVVLPEYFGIFGARATDKVAVREADGDGRQQAFLARLARAHAIWLVGGTVPIASGDPGARAQRVPRLRPRRAARRAIRQDPPVRVHARRGTLRRRQDDRARQRRRGDRAAVRPGRAFGVLRPALSRALPRHGDARADPRAVGVHRDDRRRALASAAARPRRREPMLRARGGAGRRASRRTAHLRPLGADRPVGSDRRGARPGSGVSSSATSIPRASRACAPSSRRSRTACCRGGCAHDDRRFERAGDGSSLRGFRARRRGGIRADRHRRGGGRRVRAPIRSAADPHRPGGGRGGAVRRTHRERVAHGESRDARPRRELSRARRVARLAGRRRAPLAAARAPGRRAPRAGDRGGSAAFAIEARSRPRAHEDRSAESGRAAS